jgi:hypothetical protein
MYCLMGILETLKAVCSGPHPLVPVSVFPLAPHTPDIPLHFRLSFRTKLWTTTHMMLCYTISSDRYSTTLRLLVDFRALSFLQTQGDAWFKPSAENIHAGVCLRIQTGQYRVFPYENLFLEPFEAAVRVLNPVVAVKVRSAAVHVALSTV